MIMNNLFGLENRSMVVTGAGVDQDATLKRIFGLRNENHAGVPVDEETPMTISGWYAAVKLLAWSTAFLPLFVYRRQPNGDREPDRTHPVFPLLHGRSNADMNSMIYRELGIIYILLWGDSYSWIERSFDGRPVALWPLHPRDVKVERAANRALVYDISQINDPPTGKKTLFADEVLHVPGLGFDGIHGKSIVSLASEQVGEGVASQQFASGFYSGGQQKQIALKHPGKLKTENIESLRQQWKDKHGHAGSGPPVLESGMDVVSIGIPQADAQYIESRQFSVTDAARWTGIPPHKIGDLQHATFSNIAEQNIEFVQAMLPWMHRFEQEYNWKLFPAAQREVFFVEHLVDALLSADPEKRANAISSALQNGYMNRNQAARLQNRNSIGPAGDIYTVQVNLQDIEQLGKEEDSDNGTQGTDTNTEGNGEAAPSAPSSTEENSRTVPAGRTVPTDDQRNMIVGSLRGTLQAALLRMIRKECAEARTAAARPGEFVKWLDKFYRRSHPPKVESSLLPVCEALRTMGIEIDPGATAKQFCQRSHAALLDLAGHSKAANLAEKVETEVSGWERSLAGTLTDTLFEEVNRGKRNNNPPMLPERGAPYPGA